MEKNIHVRYVSDEFISSHYVKTFKFELCENIIWFLTFYSFLAIAAYKRSNSIAVVYTAMTIIIPVFIMTYFRVRFKSLISIIISTILITVISIFIFQAIFKMLEVSLFIIPWGIQCMIKGRKYQKLKFNINNILINELIIAFELIISIFFNAERISGFILGLGIVMGTFALIYLYRARTSRFFIKDNLESGKVEVSNDYSRKGFTWITVLIIAMIVFTLFFTGAFSLGNKASKELVNYITSTIDIKVERNSNNKQEVNYTPNIPMSNPQGNKEPNIFVKIFSYIFGLLNQVIFLIVLIFVLIVSCILLYRGINYYLLKLKGKKNGDKIEYIYQKRKNIERENKFKPKFSFEINKNMKNRDKIRSKYKRKILSYKKKISLDNTFTTGEIEEAMKEKTNYNISDLTKVYNKARYSNEDISDNEVKKFK